MYKHICMWSKTDSMVSRDNQNRFVDCDIYQGRVGISFFRGRTNVGLRSGLWTPPRKFSGISLKMVHFQVLCEHFEFLAPLSLIRGRGSCPNNFPPLFARPWQELIAYTMGIACWSYCKYNLTFDYKDVNLVRLSRVRS